MPDQPPDRGRPASTRRLAARRRRLQRRYGAPTQIATAKALDHLQAYIPAGRRLDLDTAVAFATRTEAGARAWAALNAIYGNPVYGPAPTPALWDEQGWVYVIDLGPMAARLAAARET